MIPKEILSSDIKRLEQTLRFIARPRNYQQNPETLEEIQRFIEEKWKSLGYRVTHHPFSYDGNAFYNSIAEHPQNPEGLPLLIGAHFDAVPGSPGADDNASGVAAMMEASRVSAKQSPGRPLRFIAFHMEEYGMIGSTAYVKSLKEKNEKIFGMLSLEMVGYASDEKGSQHLPAPLKPFYPDTGNFIALVANSKSKKFLKEAEKTFRQIQNLPVETLSVPLEGWLLPATRLSDHSPFWDHGYPALLVTDTSFFRNPHYHRLSDTIETLNLDFLNKVTQAVIQFCRIF